jgi:hypothetical protein
MATLSRAVVPDYRTLLLAVCVGLVAATTSIGRLWLSNQDSLDRVLWAEDGLFPMCVARAGFLDCAVEPFAGYLLLGPRVVAGVVALVPLSAWSIIANLSAALTAAVLCGGVAWHLRAAGFSLVAASAVGLLPVVLPLAGLEVVNSVASMYMPLLFLAIVTVCVPVSGRRGTWSVAGILVLTALTIPSVVVLALIVLLELARRWIPAQQVVIWLGAIVIGLIPQVVVVLTADQRRSMEPSLAALLAWADSTSISLSSLIPGMQINQSAPSFDGMQIQGWAHLGVYLTLAVAAIGVIGYLRARARVNGQLALLVLAGLLAGFVPSVIGETSNRYHVIPLLCWVAALLLYVDERARLAGNRWWLPVGLLATAVLWWPALPASAYRTSSGPDWPAEVLKARAVCAIRPSATATFLFSPNWPVGDGGEPMPAHLPCSTVNAKQ